MGLYLSFNNLYSSWLILLTIAGIITSILIHFFGNGKADYAGLPVYGAIIVLVVTFVDQFWKRRENELVFLWDLKAYSANEPQRKEHKGRWIIDEVSRKIRKKNRLSTLQRRMISEIPVILLGLFFIIGNYVLFFFLNKNLADQLQSKEMDKNTAKNYAFLLGGANGMSISVLSVIYQYVVQGVISWENHRFESTHKASRIPKLFLFNFCMHYINLFFYAFYLQDFTVLRSNFISLFITRAISNLALTYGMPLVLYWFQLKLYKKKLTNQWILRKKAFTQQNLISGKWFFDLSPSLQLEAKEYEEQLYIWTQVENSLLRPAPLDLTLIWMNQLLQFGFLVFFGVVFPLAPLIGLIFNLLDAFLLTYCSSQVNQRNLLIILPNSGIWTYIITLMTFMALVINAALFAFVSSGFRDLVNASGDYKLLLLLAISEHFLFGLKVLISFLISDMPRWVRIQIKKRKVKVEMYAQAQFEFKFINNIKNNIQAISNSQKIVQPPVQENIQEMNLILEGLQKKQEMFNNQNVMSTPEKRSSSHEHEKSAFAQIDIINTDLQTTEELEENLLYGTYLRKNK